MSASIRSSLPPRDPNQEFVRVMTHATVEKRTEDYDDALGLYLARGASRFEGETKAARAIRPYEVLVGDYNAMVDNGIDLALLLLVGGVGTAFNNANARLGVGARQSPAEACGEPAPRIDPRPHLRDEFDIHSERLVDVSRPRVRGNERESVLPRGRADERVVDGTAGDPQPG
jgi:hypothetical protein